MASTFLSFVHRHLDLLVLGLLTGATLFLELYPSPRIQQASLSDPSLLKPHLPSIIPPTVLLPLAFLAPPLILVPLHLPNPLPSLRPFTLALLHSNVLTAFLTNALKLLVGRPRPFFATVCQHYVPPTSLNCTTSSLSLIRDARKSFPSGHSSLSFSAALTLVFALVRHSPFPPPLRKQSGLPRNPLSRLLLLALPIFVATLVAVSRLIDFHHHYSDVLAGIFLGSAVAFSVNLAHYPARRPSASSSSNESLPSLPEDHL